MSPLEGLRSVSTLDLLSEVKRRLETPQKKNIILIGPPGSGKGTQARANVHDLEPRHSLDLQALLDRLLSSRRTTACATLRRVICSELQSLQVS